MGKKKNWRFSPWWWWWYIMMVVFVATIIQVGRNRENKTILKDTKYLWFNQNLIIVVFWRHQYACLRHFLPFGSISWDAFMTCPVGAVAMVSKTKTHVNSQARYIHTQVLKAITKWLVLNTHTHVWSNFCWHDRVSGTSTSSSARYGRDQKPTEGTE